MSDPAGVRRRAVLGAVLGASLSVFLPAVAARDPSSPVVTSIGEIAIVTPGCDVGPCRPIFSEADVRGWLAGVVGKRFEERAIQWRIARHYVHLGYEPDVRLDFGGGRLGARILESSGFVTEVISDPNLPAGLLPPDLMKVIPEPRRDDVPRRTLRTKPGDLANAARLAADEYDVGALGWDIVPLKESEEPGAPQRYLLTPRPRLGAWRAAEEASAAPAGEKGAPAPSLPVEPLHLRSYDGDVVYTNRDLLTIRLVYQRSHLFRRFDLVEVSPYVTQRLAGSLRYHLSYILPESITPWDVYLDVKAYDELTPDRVLEGVETDERRIGARLEAGVEPYRNHRGNTLRGGLFANRYHVVFGQVDYSVEGGIVSEGAPVEGGELNDLTVFGATMDWTFDHSYRAPKYVLRWIATAETASRALGSDIAFRRIRGEIRQHLGFSMGFELDLSWKAGVADSDTPIFEQFTLGGQDTLRGFNRDDFIGTRLYAAQNDLWVPFVFRSYRGGNRFLGALARNLKTAITFDVGSVSTEDLLEVRLARGFGIGLRYVAEKSPLLLRIDVAYGYWRGLTAWYPYISVARRW